MGGRLNSAVAGSGNRQICWFRFKSRAIACVIYFLRDGFMPFTFTVTSTSTFTMVAGDIHIDRCRQTVQPAWNKTVEKVSACRARARARERVRERMIHAIALGSNRVNVDKKIMMCIIHTIWTVEK
jgi:hypothetical protein